MPTQSLRPPVLYVCTTAANKAFISKLANKVDKNGKRIGISKVINAMVLKLRKAKR